jgi:hypothetical protein
VIIAVIAVRVVKVPIDEVVDMVSMGNRLMTTVGAVLVS